MTGTVMPDFCSLKNTIQMTGKKDEEIPFEEFSPGDVYTLDYVRRNIEDVCIDIISHDIEDWHQGIDNQRENSYFEGH